MKPGLKIKAGLKIRPGNPGWFWGCKNPVRSSWFGLRPYLGKGNPTRPSRNRAEISV